MQPLPLVPSRSRSASPVASAGSPRTLTISANRTTYLQPDEVVFGVSVTSGVATTADQIVAALSGLGIASSNLTGVNTTSAPPNLQWAFNLAIPLSNLTAILASLAKLQQTIAQNDSGLTLTFNVNGTEVSQQLQQSQSCSNSDLIADATTQAQKLAPAAGLTLGATLQLSNAPLIQPYAAASLVAEIFLALLARLPWFHFLTSKLCTRFCRTSVTGFGCCPGTAVSPWRLCFR
jgi:hypothetical protein